MHAVIWPIRHRGMGSRVYKIALCVIWVLSAPLIATLAIEEHLFHRLLTPMVISTATFTIVLCNLSIWISLRRRKRRQLGIAAVRRDSTLAVTLLMVSGFFLIGWGIPTFYLSISQMKICKNCYKPTPTVRRCIQLVFVVQSLINPVIYSLRLPAFRASWRVRLVRDSENLESRRCPGKRQTTQEIEMINASLKT